MIIVKLYGGLGNQLFQYALGRKLSIAKNVEFKIDVSPFEKYKLHNYSLDFFNIVNSKAVDADLEKYYVFFGNGVYSRARKKIEKCLPFFIKKYVNESIGG